MQAYFLKLKSNLELDPTFDGVISTRHAAIRTYLKNNHPGFKDSKLVGSLQRTTRNDPGSGHQFDVDILVILGEFYHWLPLGQGISAQDALNAVHATIADSTRYGAMSPRQDPPTISLTYGDEVVVQLVPAYVDMIGRDHLGN